VLERGISLSLDVISALNTSRNRQVLHTEENRWSSSSQSMVNMRPRSENMEAYIRLREEVVNNVPENFDVSRIKTKILETETRFATKRRVERIKTIRELVKELENQLLIFPERRGIRIFYSISRQLQNHISSETLKEIEKLTEKLEPREQKTSPARPVSSCKPAPDSIKAILEAGLTEAGTGQDWSHFSTNLGFDCKEKQKIRLRQGDVDRMERQNSDDIRKLLRQVVEKFEDNCRRHNVTIDVTDHIIEVLKNEEIFFPPYKSLARKIKEAKKEL